MPAPDRTSKTATGAHAELFDRLAVVLAELGGSEPAIDQARARAHVLLNGTPDGEAVSAAALSFAADGLAAVILERVPGPDEVAELVGVLVDLVPLKPRFVAASIYVHAARDPRLADLAPVRALEAQLGLLLALSPTGDVSLWLPRDGGQLECVVSLGRGVPTRRARAEARRLLHGLPSARDRERAQIHALPVLRWERPCAALVVRAKPDDRDHCLMLAQHAALAVRPTIERDLLLGRSAARESALVESSERRLARLGLDLHDGAIQDLAVLAGDVRLFRKQLNLLLPGNEENGVLLGRVDDLEARLVAVDRDLRELATSLESSTMLKRPLLDVLRQEVSAFGARTEIRAKLDLKGELPPLSASQRIALMRIIQEALANVREHSGASDVRVSVVGGSGWVRAEVVDDGSGFDVDRALVRAARRGRLGLVGMSERVRLLGGSFDIRSRPGGPTTISVTLPEWRPFTEGAATSEAESKQRRA